MINGRRFRGDACEQFSRELHESARSRIAAGYAMENKRKWDKSRWPIIVIDLLASGGCRQGDRIVAGISASSQTRRGGR